MKYWINKMKCNTLSQQVCWLDGRGVYLHFKGQMIKLHKWCVCGQQWYVDQIFSYVTP